MKSNLSRFFFASAAVAAMALASIPVVAETTPIKVPFNFTVNGQKCAAGLYSVQRDSSGNLLRLVGGNSSQGFSWAANSQSDSRDSRVVLKFDEDGQEHTLRSVQYGHVVTSNLDKRHTKSERARSFSGE